MTYQFPPDIEALIQQQLATGNYESPDQLFRVALEQLTAQDGEIRAMKSQIRGTPGKELLKFAGTISQEDAQTMIKAIEEGCEQIDANDW